MYEVTHNLAAVWGIVSFFWLGGGIPPPKKYWNKHWYVYILAWYFVVFWIILCPVQPFVIFFHIHISMDLSVWRCNAKPMTIAFLVSQFLFLF